MANRDDVATRTAKVLSLPIRKAILEYLLRSGPKTVKEIADHFGIHPNVARAHLEFMSDAGFLATETRRRAKGRPAKVYFTWEGERGSLEEAGVDIPTDHVSVADEVEVEIRILERTLVDAANQLARIKDLLETNKQLQGGTDG